MRQFYGVREVNNLRSMITPSPTKSATKYAIQQNFWRQIHGKKGVWCFLEFEATALPILASLSTSWVLPKPTARRLFESNSADVSWLFNCSQMKFVAIMLVLLVFLCDFSLDQFFVWLIWLFVLKNGINR